MYWEMVLKMRKKGQSNILGTILGVFALIVVILLMLKILGLI